MTFTTAEVKQLSISELHDLSEDEFSTLYIEVYRRCEPGAGAFSGVQFLSAGESAATFTTIDEALSFIDAIQQNGLPAAIEDQLSGETDSGDIVAELQYYNESVDPDEYLDEAGLHDPFNLTISPQREITKEVELSEPASRTTQTTEQDDIHA